MKHVFALAGLCLLFLQCRSVFYAPNTLHIPELSKKGDATVSGGYFTNTKFSGAEFNAAVSPVRNVGLMFNYFDTFRRYDGSFWTNTYLYEGGAGVYKYLEDFGIISLYGGFGQGQSENGQRLTPRPPDLKNYVRTSLTYHRWFLQPGLVVQSDNAEVRVGLRVVWLAPEKAQIDPLFSHANDLLKLSKQREYPCWNHTLR
jgi:hypothetical protein